MTSRSSRRDPLWESSPDAWRDDASAAGLEDIVVPYAGVDDPLAIPSFTEAAYLIIGGLMSFHELAGTRPYHPNDGVVPIFSALRLTGDWEDAATLLATNPPPDSSLLSATSHSQLLQSDIAFRRVRAELCRFAGHVEPDCAGASGDD